MFKPALASLLLLLQPLVSVEDRADPIVTVVERASQSVVFIATEANPFDISYGQQPGNYEYLRPIYDYFWPAEHAHGSGFIVTPDGYIVTNAHVVEGSTKVLVVMRSNEMQICKASVIGKDLRTDIAVLKIDDPLEVPLPVLKFGDSNQIQIGEQVVCIGNPLTSQLESSVTAGIISGIDRNNFGLDPIEGYIQTDTVINGGNSGCPMLNTQGEVIGVICWGYNHYSGHEGLSFAIPSYVARHIANQLILHGKVSQGFLGAELDLDNDEESAFGIYYFDRNEGARIKTIIQDSPAEQADLRSGDLILMVNYQLVRSAKSLRNQIAILEPGTIVQLTLDREGTILRVTLKLGSEELSNAHSNLEGPPIVI